MQTINNINRVSRPGFRIMLMLILMCLMSNCKKLIEIEAPIGEIVADKVYSNTSAASSVLLGIYKDLSNNGSGISCGEQGLSVILGLTADELGEFTGINQFYINSLVKEENYKWTTFYYFIYRINGAIEGVSRSSSLIPEVKDRLIGEAKFLRAFCYFYMVNLFGDVPLLLSTDYITNGIASREDAAVVYQQIIKDLKESQDLLDENYVGLDILSNSLERARPNKAAATALLARVYLYTGDWVNAETESGKLIENITSYSLAGLEGVFLKNSNEAIWQLQPVDISINTGDGAFFIPSTPDDNLFVYLSDELLTKFEVNDNRKLQWVQQHGSSAYYYPYKYKVRAADELTEYLMVLRLGEQYLIRAEARAQQNNISGAEEDLFAIRNRAGLGHTTAATQEEMLEAILHERQIELFTEWGHRWLDLKRTGKADEVLSIVKGSFWQDTDVLFPIPASEIEKNSSLRGHQNDGY